jgi:hypothetical protein
MQNVNVRFRAIAQSKTEYPQCVQIEAVCRLSAICGSSQDQVRLVGFSSKETVSSATGICALNELST